MAEPDGVTVVAYIPRWPAVDRALHVALRDLDLTAEVVPLNTFLPAAEHEPHGRLVLVDSIKTRIESACGLVSALEKHNTMKRFQLCFQFQLVPLHRGASSSLPDGHPLPNGTCLLLVRRRRGDGDGAGASGSDEAPPETRVRGVMAPTPGPGYGTADYLLSAMNAMPPIQTAPDGEKVLTLRLRPEHMTAGLPEACRRAGVDSDATPTVSVEVDATGPFAVTPAQAEAGASTPPLLSSPSAVSTRPPLSST